LDGNRRIAADFDLTELNFSGFSTLNHLFHYREATGRGQSAINSALIAWSEVAVLRSEQDKSP
jgi:hypothetical protein